MQAKQSFKVKNDSRIPLEYEWRVPEKYRNEVTFEPQRSMLLPNESAKVMANFTPLRKKDYQITVPLFTKNLVYQIKNSVGFFHPGSGLTLTKQNNADSQFGMQASKSIQIIGAGSDGQIKINPDKLDFGTITVGYSKTLSVVITNSSNCNLYIELKMMKVSKTPEIVPRSRVSL